MSSIEQAIAVSAPVLQPLATAYDALTLAEAMVEKVVTEGHLIPADQLVQVGVVQLHGDGVVHQAQGECETLGCVPVYRRVQS